MFIIYYRNFKFKRESKRLGKFLPPPSFLSLLLGLTRLNGKVFKNVPSQLLFYPLFLELQIYGHL